MPRQRLITLCLVVASAGACRGDDAEEGATGEVMCVAPPCTASGTDASSDGTEATTVSSDATRGSTSADPATSDASSGAGTSTGEADDPSSSRHTPRPLGTTAALQGYWEYLPPAYDDGGTHPLLVSLHGIDENGNGTDDLDKVAVSGIARLITNDSWPADRPFVVLSPQYGGAQCPGAADVDAFLTYALDAYAVDPDHVYLAGLSCGAFGGWNYLGQHLDDVVTAAVLIAGNGQAAFNNAGCELGRIPIWAFHGDADTIVTPDGTTVTVANLEACNPAPANLAMTIYPGVGHDSWTRTYDLSAGHDIYTWLLSF